MAVTKAKGLGVLRKQNDLCNPPCLTTTSRPPPLGPTLYFKWNINSPRRRPIAVVMLMWLLLPGPSRRGLKWPPFGALRVNLLECYVMVARCRQQECERAKLLFRALQFSPSISLCCAFERDIHALSVRLSLFADLPRQVCHGASARLPLPTSLIAVIKQPPAATS